MQKRHVALILVLLFACVVLGILSINHLGSNEKTTQLVFVGDIMLSRSIDKIITREGNPFFHFLKIKEITERADITFGNLEGPASVRGIDQGSIYSFRANPDNLKGLVFAGFDIVSIANNHIFDWGKGAFVDTIDHLNALGIMPVGGGKNSVEAYAIRKIVRNGETFCFFAYSEFTSLAPSKNYPAIFGLNEKEMIRDINRAKVDQCQAIIISIHWGNEYETESSLWQQQLAHTLIDQGATLIVGHHPHVVQEVEKYKDGLIAYSLGNFVFDQNFSDETRKGLILEVSMKKGLIQSFRKIPIAFSRDFEPYTLE